MKPTLISAACLALALSVAAVASAQQRAPAAPATAAGVSAADAAPFIGDWTLNMEGPMGPNAILLSVKTDAGKVLGEISSEMIPKTPITDISKTGTSLVLKYSITFDGNAVPVVVTLTPAADKVGANLDFGGGTFAMAGTATKVAK